MLQQWVPVLKKGLASFCLCPVRKMYKYVMSQGVFLSVEG